MIKCGKMSARTTKQILYGAFFVTFVSALALWFYAGVLAPSPSCSDGVRNQKEESVDCGGPCLSCAVKDLDLLVKKKTIVPIEALNRTTFFVELENPSVDFWVKKFDYAFRIYNSLGVIVGNFKGSSYVNPGGDREISYVAEDFDPRDARQFDFEVTNEEWAPIEEYNDSGIRVVRRGLDERNGKIVVFGTIRNSSSDPISLLRVGAVFSDKVGNFVNVSTTVVENFEALSSRNFEIILLPGKEDIDMDQVRIFTKVLK